jgi:hypothetical protein
MIPQTISPALDNAYFVIQPFHKAERDFFLGIDIGGDVIPVAFNHLSKIVVGFEPLPLQGGSPVIKKPSCPPEEQEAWMAATR